MSKSYIKNKWIRKQFANTDRSHNHHRLDEVPKNTPSRYITENCDISKVRWLQETTSFGGHSIPKGGHRMVSGIVRSKIKEKVKKQIISELD